MPGNELEPAQGERASPGCGGGGGGWGGDESNPSPPDSLRRSL